MHSEGNEVHVSEEEASGGSKEGVVRWVLIVGTLLAIVGLSVIWITGAAFRSDPDADNANVSRQIAEQQERAAENATAGEPIAPATTVEEDDREVVNGDPAIRN